MAIGHHLPGSRDISDSASGEGLPLPLPEVDILPSIQQSVSQTDRSLGPYLGPAATPENDKLNDMFDASKKFIGRWEPELQPCPTADEPFLSLNSIQWWDNLEPLQKHESISTVTWSRILTMVIDNCDRGNLQNILSGFPGPRILDQFLQDFLTWHSEEPDTWIHVTTFRANDVQPALLAGCIAIGAAKSSYSEAQNFGFALHKILHIHLLKTVCEHHPWLILLWLSRHR